VRASQYDSDAELHSDSLNNGAPPTPPKTPAHGIGSQDTGATLPISGITLNSHRDDELFSAGARRPVASQPSPIELPPSQPTMLRVGGLVRQKPGRLNLEAPVKSAHSIGSNIPATIKEEVVHSPWKRDRTTLARDESSDALQQATENTPTNALSKLGLSSPCREEEHPNVGLRLEHKPAPLALPSSPPSSPPMGGSVCLDALSVLCNLASTPSYSRCEEAEMKEGEDTEGLPSARKRPRRNVERRNWSTLSNHSSGSSDLGEAQCLDEEEDEDDAVAKALAVAKAPAKETIARASGSSNSAKCSLIAAVLEGGQQGQRDVRDSDEDEEVEADTPEDEEDDEEWSPKDGDWSPQLRQKHRHGLHKLKGSSPRSLTPSSKGRSPRPLNRRPSFQLDSLDLEPAAEDEDEDDLTIPVDVKKGGKIPELIRSKRAASGFVGVDFHEGKWRARVRIGVGIRGQPNRLVIGRYSTAHEAAIAYAKYINSAAGKKLVAGGRG